MCKFTITLAVLAACMLAVVGYIAVVDGKGIADVAVGVLAGVMVGCCAYAVHVCKERKVK